VRAVIASGGVKFHPDLEPLLVDIARVRPHPDNPSNGDQDAIEESIEINGMYRPVYVQRSTGYVLGGNTTYAACLGLGAEVIPVIWLDVDAEGAWRILLGDNQIARLALVDKALLLPQLDALLQTELRLLGTGFAEQPPQVEPEFEPSHTITVQLKGEHMVSWFDLPGATDRSRLLWLLEEWREGRAA
jgi:ParB-like chromosome segregation protein Spo0J